MAFLVVVGAMGSSGRFVPPLTVARTGLGLTAGQFKITDASYTLYTYILTGANTTRSGNIVSLNATTATGTIAATGPKGIVSSAVVNIARTPYTFYSHYSETPYCATNWHSGQCAGWGSHGHYSGPYKNTPPTSYTDSEGEWWRIW